MNGTVVMLIASPFFLAYGISCIIKLKQMKETARKSSLILTQLGMDIILLDGSRQFISWQDVKGLFARTHFKNLSIRIIFADGEYVTPDYLLLDTDKTLRFIKEHVPLEVKSKGFIWTEYQRRA